MKELKVREYNLDWIMENYFNTDKEIMFICDYDTAWEILKYSEYEKEDFKYFNIKLDNKKPYYYIYKNDCTTFTVQPSTFELILYTIYTVDNVLIQDVIYNIYKDIIYKCDINENIVILKHNNDVDNLRSLEENYLNEEQEHQCDCNTCCDECCEDEKEEVFDRIYQQGVIDTIKLIAELL